MGSTPSPAMHATRANEQILGVMLVVHGAVHLIGFVLAWRIFEPGGFAYGDVWPDAGTGPGQAVGLGWLATAIGLIVMGSRLAARRDPSPLEIAVPLLASLALCVLSSPAALPGAVFSSLVLGLMVAIRARRIRAARTFDPFGTGRELGRSGP